MRWSKGAGVLELLVVVSMVFVLSILGFSSYQKYIIKAQVIEAKVALNDGKDKHIFELLRHGKCASTTQKSKNGILVLGGVGDKSVLEGLNAHLETGCLLTYTFLDSGLSQSLKNKKLVLDLFNNGVMSLNGLTTVDSEFLPKSISVLIEDEAPEKIKVVVSNSVDLAKDTTEFTDIPYDYSQDLIKGNAYCFTSRPGLLYRTECYLYSDDKHKILAVIGGATSDGLYSDSYRRISATLMYVMLKGQCPKDDTKIKEVNDLCKSAGYSPCLFYLYSNCSLIFEDAPYGKNIHETGWREVVGAEITDDIYNFKNFYFNDYYTRK